MRNPRNFGAAPIIIGVLLIVITAVIFVILPNMLQPTTDLRLGDGIFKARVAISEDDRIVGLSNVSKLNSDQALLMVYPSQSRWTVQINTLKIPIDIVWLNSDKKVVYIVTNASPDSSIVDLFEPKLPAKYVVELPAGTVNAKAITTKSFAVFQINSQGF